MQLFVGSLQVCPLALDRSCLACMLLFFGACVFSPNILGCCMSKCHAGVSGTRLAFDPAPMVSHLTLPPFWGRVECEKVAFLAAKKRSRR